jgi:hypothetical protein
MGLAGLIAAAALLGTPVDLTLSSEGYTYFYKKNAELIAQQADLEECVENASRFRAIGVSDDPMATQSILSDASTPFLANVENCMVVKRWWVVRLPDEEGAQLAALSQSELSNHLATLVGAPSPEGEVIRKWANDAAAWETKTFPRRSRFKEKPSLSLRAFLLPNLKTMGVQRAIIPKPEKPIGPVRSPITSIPAGYGVVVARVSKPLKLLIIARTSSGSELLDYPELQSNRIEIGGDKPQNSAGFATYLIPKGRWTWIGMSTVRFCLGAPSFELGDGEVLFLGSFGNGRVLPTFDVSSSDSAVAAEYSLASGMKPTEYRNGTTFQCGGLGYAYAIEMQ